MLFGFTLILIIHNNAYGLSDSDPIPIQSVNVDVIFTPNPPISGEAFDIEIIFTNPNTGEIVKDIDYATRITFDHFNHSNIQSRTIESDGIVNQREIILEDCCSGYIFEVTILGLEGRTIATQYSNFPIDLKYVQSKITEVPDWVKNNAGWWAGGGIYYNEFIPAIQYLMDQGLLNTGIIPDKFPPQLKENAGNWANGQISDKEFLSILDNWIKNPSAESIVPSTSALGPETPFFLQLDSEYSDTSTEIPDWVKGIAGWWAEDKISESEFISAMEFLVTQEIIKPSIVTELQNQVSELQEKLDSAQKKISSLEQQLSELGKVPSDLDDISEPDLSVEKGIADAWSKGQITDAEYIIAMQKLIDEGKILPFDGISDEYNTNNSIPSWIKNNAGWWSNGKIDEESYRQGILYLFKIGVLRNPLN